MPIASQASTKKSWDSNLGCVASKHSTALVVCSIIIISFMCMIVLYNLPNSFIKVIFQ